MHESPRLYTLAVSSFAVHGSASLKTIIKVLGSRVLPVPSVVLNGLTNMPGVRKFDLSFHELLQGTFELVEYRQLDVILSIGYLGQPEHVDVLLELIAKYRKYIKVILTDPISGDHGRAYVPEAIIKRWPQLIAQADLVFPNLTEIKLLTGHAPTDKHPVEYFIERFKATFPQVQLVLTSLQLHDHGIGVQWHGEGEPFTYAHPVLGKNYGGSGDAFLALFILLHYYKNYSIEDALRSAADQTFLLIRQSIEQQSEELVLDQLEENLQALVVS